MFPTDWSQIIVWVLWLLHRRSFRFVLLYLVLVSYVPFLFMLLNLVYEVRLHLSSSVYVWHVKSPLKKHKKSIINKHYLQNRFCICELVVDICEQDHIYRTCFTWSALKCFLHLVDLAYILYWIPFLMQTYLSRLETGTTVH